MALNLALCSDLELGQSSFNDCDPAVNESEIEKIWIAAPGASPLANIQDLSEFGNRVSQNSIGPNAIRELTVIGDMPAPAAVSKDISNGRKITIGSDYTLNASVDDISDDNYDFFRGLDGSPFIRAFAFQTFGGKRYHYGNNGWIVNYDSNIVLARGRDAIEEEQIVITWRDKVRPQRFSVGTTDNTTSFDSDLIFAQATSDTEDGVSGTAPAVNANEKLEFNGISPRVGFQANMTIKVGGVSKLVVQYLSDYNGEPFKFTNTDSVVYYGTFTDGTINFA